MLNQQLIFTRDVLTGAGATLRLQYYRLIRNTPDGPRYGVAVHALAPDGETHAEAEDLTSLPARIDHLLALLSDGAVTPVSLRDVLEDLL